MHCRVVLPAAMSDAAPLESHGRREGEGEGERAGAGERESERATKDGLRAHMAPRAAMLVCIPWTVQVKST